MQIKRMMAVAVVVAGVVSGCKETKKIDTHATTPKAAPAATTGGKEYRVADPAALAVGSTDGATVDILPASGFKINVEYPWKFEFKGAEGGDVSAPIVKKGDGIEVSDAKATVKIPVAAKAAGPVKVLAIANFSVCNDNVCKNYRDEEITLTLNATDTAAQ